MNKFVCINYSELDDYYGNLTNHGVAVYEEFEQLVKELGLEAQYDYVGTSAEDGPSEHDFQQNGWFKGTEKQIKDICSHFADNEIYVVTESEYEDEQKRIQEEMNGDYDPYYNDSVYGLSANI